MNQICEFWAAIVRTGEAKHDQGDLAKAEYLYNKALDQIVYDEDLPRRAQHLGLIMSHLGDVYSDLQRHSEAEFLYRRALSFFGESAGQNDWRIVLVMRSLAQSLTDQGREHEGKRYHVAATVLANVLFGLDDFDTNMPMEA
jgi:tetratricopeptide (TPR) repeat protein